MPTTATALPKRHRHNVADYHRMTAAGILAPDARVELIEGEIIDMAPIGCLHASVVKKLARAFQLAAGETALVSVQDPVRLSDFSEPQPDLALLRWRADFYAGAHPAGADVFLIVEVADTTLEYDRDVKVPLYARCGVPEVWLVDVSGRTIMRFTEPAAAGYRQVQGISGIIGPMQLPACAVDLDLLW